VGSLTWHFLLFILKNLERISLNESRFLRKEHARLGQEAVVQRQIVELTRELEAAPVSMLHERGRATAAE
jgi:hypothetical protein